MTESIPRTAVRVDPHVVAQKIGREAVLIHLDTNRIYELNSTATRVWELVQSGLDRATIERRLVDEFDIDPDRLTRELDAFFAALSHRNVFSEWADSGDHG